MLGYLTRTHERSKNNQSETLPAMKETISAVVRFHDVSAIAQLERAIQGLHSQTGVSVQPIIVMQRFDRESVARTSAAVARQWYFDGLPEPVLINFDDGETGDARSKLLNEGVSAHRKLGNRYLAFLDYDDILYTHAYRTLVEPLSKTGAVVSFASVEWANVVSLRDYEFVYRLSMPWKGKNKLDLIKENFCPLHSYMVDTAKVPGEELFFRGELVRVEDYDFLLRVAGKYPCDFSNLDVRIGMYIHRNDASNSTPTWTGLDADREKMAIWRENRDRLNALRVGYEVRLFASDF